MYVLSTNILNAYLFSNGLHLSEIQVNVCSHTDQNKRPKLQYIQLDCFVVKETKSDNIFASAQFMLNDYEVRARINRDKNGCGLIEYVRGGVIC